MNEEEIKDVIREYISCVGSLTQVAREIGVSPAYLSDVMRGNRRVSERVANHFGWSRVTKFVRTMQASDMADKVLP